MSHLEVCKACGWNGLDDACNHKLAVDAVDAPALRRVLLLLALFNKTSQFSDAGCTLGALRCEMRFSSGMVQPEPVAGFDFGVKRPSTASARVMVAC